MNGPRQCGQSNGLDWTGLVSRVRRLKGGSGTPVCSIWDLQHARHSLRMELQSTNLPVYCCIHSFIPVCVHSDRLLVGTRPRTGCGSTGPCSTSRRAARRGRAGSGVPDAAGEGGQRGARCAPPDSAAVLGNGQESDQSTHWRCGGRGSRGGQRDRRQCGERGRRQRRWQQCDWRRRGRRTGRRQLRPATTAEPDRAVAPGREIQPQGARCGSGSCRPTSRADRPHATAHQLARRRAARATILAVTYADADVRSSPSLPQHCCGLRLGGCI